MCDFALPSVETLKHSGDSAVAAAITECARIEAIASARRLAAIAEMVARHANGPTGSARWSCDNWDAMAAEVAAAQGISHAMASGQMYVAVALRDRLPRVGAIFAEGIISARLASTMVWHTDLIKDRDTLHLVDQTLAEGARHFGPLSVSKTAQAINAVVDRHDPAAVRRTRLSARGREVVISPADDGCGTAQFWGSLYANDAAVLDRRLTDMAHQVCANDPRTVDQRRADALGVLAAGGQHLACGCATPECQVGASTDARAKVVVIHVVAEAQTLTASPDPHTSGQRIPRPITPDMTLAEALAPDPEPDLPAQPRPPAAHLTGGGGTLPAPMVAELIRKGARLQPLHHRADTPPEARYRPSAELERFIRCRDMTCRFPGCDRPAEFADIDHTIPYPLGPTHPSNLKCLCRKH
ncbi:MAG TPA: DUF222 domain-containing protein [Mycobacterium sp.]|nr:DUF222 domain-containing protein [Mycobacterium sp.]HTX94020.1 DUF222 domain-containing protein [Mycobacterium sp.]